MANSTDRVARILSTARRERRRTKTNRTLSFDEPQAAILFEYCARERLHVSKVVNMLVADFLEELGDQLTQEQREKLRAAAEDDTDS